MRGPGCKRSLSFAVLLPALLSAGSAMAADPAVGRWKTIDSDTGKPKSIVEIRQSADGTLTGRIIELIDPSKPDPACDKCSDDRKGKPIDGMEIIRGMKAEGAGRYAGGTILKPDEGRIYKSKMELVEGGQQLRVSGCIAFACKAQTWLRP